MTVDLAAIGEAGELLGGTSALLEAAFAAGSAPDPGELDGAYEGRLLCLPVLNAIPERTRRTILSVLTPPVLPWRGKRFSADVTPRGSNTWLTSLGPHFASFTCAVEGDDLVLAYDRPLGFIRGTVRRLAPGLYLGRVRVTIGAAAPTVLWFSLDNV